MSNPLDRLRNVKQKAESTDEARALYRNFIAYSKRYMGWTDVDESEYVESIKILMGKNDTEALALFPDGVYPSANAAREAAIEYWKSTK